MVLGYGWTRLHTCVLGVMAMICILSCFVAVYFLHVLQDYFTYIWTILWFPKCQRRKHEEQGKMGHTNAPQTNMQPQKTKRAIQILYSQAHFTWRSYHSRCHLLINASMGRIDLDHFMVILPHCVVNVSAPNAREIALLRGQHEANVIVSLRLCEWRPNGRMRL